VIIPDPRVLTANSRSSALISEDKRFVTVAHRARPLALALKLRGTITVPIRVIALK
jgi:hypothetical protein